MKKLLESKNLPLCVLLLGILGFLLRFVLYAVGVDEKNLLPFGHPVEIALWLVMAAAALLVIVAVWRLDGSNRYADNFQPSLTAAVGAFVFAAGIVLTVLSSGESSLNLNRVRNLLGFLAAACLVATGISRMQGKRPFFGFHGVVCVYLAVHMISRYRTWSGNPQAQDYVFSMFGMILLTLFAFYQTSFDVGSGRRRMQLFTGLMAACFSLIALSNTEFPLLYLTGCVWAMTNLCSLTPVAREQKKKAE